MSVRVAVFRRALAATKGSLTDGGVLAVTCHLESALALGFPPDDGSTAVAMLKEGLAAAFPASVVSSGTTYQWQRCSDGKLKFVCIEGAELEIADGGASPVVVELEAHEHLTY